MSEKMTRKEMRAPDAFQRAGGGFWQKVLEHRRVVIGGLVVLAGLLVVAAWLDFSSFRKEKAAGAALADALDAARRPVEGASDPSTDPALEKFASADDKRSEIGTRLAAVAKDFPGSRSAETALLFLGNTKLVQGQQDEAQKAFHDFLAQSLPTNPMRFLAWEGLGYSFEAQKAYDKALEAFSNIAVESPGDNGKILSSYHRARILELSGKKMEAAVELQKIKEGETRGPVVTQAVDRLNALIAQGIVPPKTETPAEKASEKK